MSDFTQISEAIHVARERASVAATFEAELLHRAVFEAREAGMSVREAAAALRVPKSTVARHWRNGHRCPAVLPVWGSEALWQEAHAAVWAHDDKELADDRVPYEWIDDGTQRTIKARPLGTAVLSDDA